MPPHVQGNGFQSARAAVDDGLDFAFDGVEQAVYGCYRHVRIGGDDGVGQFAVDGEGIEAKSVRGEGGLAATLERVI
jgi:hypothetical protein